MLGAENRAKSSESLKAIKTRAWRFCFTGLKTWWEPHPTAHHRYLRAAARARFDRGAVEAWLFVVRPVRRPCVTVRRRVD
jgi:hypothetical protein